MIKHEDERAFPVTMEDGRGASMTNLGMTLRDYFAAKSMQGICGHPDTWGLADKGIVRRSYEVADAMLAERAK